VTVSTLSSQPVAVLASSRLAGDDQHAAGRAQQSAMPEDVVGLDVASSAASSPAGADPEHEAVLADSVGVAMLVVLETLSPAERRFIVLAARKGMAVVSQGGAFGAEDQACHRY
jgi:hypothetical protein